MKKFKISSQGRRMVNVWTGEAPRPPQATESLGAEAASVLKRLMVIADDQARSAKTLGIELQSEDLCSVIAALRGHARGGPSLPVPGARDEIRAHVLDRFFEELVDEPSNILFSTTTGHDRVRYDAMASDFWIDCLDLLERTLFPN